MNPIATALLALTLVFGAIDWWAVQTDRPGVEYWFKPLTVVVMGAMAISLDRADDQVLAVLVWFVLALAFSLFGDVLLMLPKEQFLGGLVMFLAAHLAYIGGLVTAGQSLWWFVAGIGLVAVALATIGRSILSSVADGEPSLRVPVALYSGVIGLMVATAIGTRVPWAIGGALLFMTSDALLGGNKFLGALPGGRTAVHVTYHLGQLGLILTLIGL